MRLRVDNPAFLPELLEFIERRGGVVTTTSENELEAGLLGSYASHQAMRMQLYLLVRAWEADRAGPMVEIVG
jgi:hypothetical protein